MMVIIRKHVMLVDDDCLMLNAAVWVLLCESTAVAKSVRRS